MNLRFIEDGNYSAHFDIETRTPGAGGNALASRLFVQSNGNVGIGTTNPSKTLHVSGTVLTTSWTGINFSSTGNVTPTAPLEVSGTISATHFVGDGSGLTNLSVQGDRITSGTASVVVAQNTGAEVSGTLKLTNTGAEVCDGAHINTLRINPTNGALEICQ